MLQVVPNDSFPRKMFQAYPQVAPMSVPNQRVLSQPFGNVTVLKQIMRMVDIGFGPHNIVGYTKSFAPNASTALDVMFLDVRGKVLEQGFTDEGAVIDHSNLH
jgi:hypothetical protein